MQVLIGLHGALPMGDRPVPGVVLRATALARGLIAAGHGVSFLTRARDLGLAGPARGTDVDGCAVWGYDAGDDLAAIVMRTRPDVFVACQPEMLGHLPDNIDTALVADLYAPRPLEFAFQKVDHALETLKFLDYLRRADHLLCTSERQRHYYLSWLAMAGFDTREPPISVVPLTAPRPTEGYLPGRARDLSVCVAGGVSWPWQDLSASLAALVAAMESEGAGTVHLYSGVYPLAGETGSGALAGVAGFGGLEGHPRIERHAFTGYPDMLANYRAAGFALSAMARNPEREMALAFRDLDQIGCGLPLITATYGVLAPLVREYEAGWVVDPDGGHEALVAALHEPLASPDEVARRSANALRLAAERFTAEVTIAPFLPFCAAPKRRVRSPGLWTEMVRIAHDGYLDRSRRVGELEEIRELREQVAELKTQHSGAVREFERALREAERDLSAARRQGELHAAQLEARKATEIASVKGEISELKARLDLATEQNSRLVAAEQTLRADIEGLKRDKARREDENRRRADDNESLREQLRAREVELDAIHGNPLYKAYRRLRG